LSSYPLLFSFLDKVEGNKFLARVAVHGRLLAVEEDGAWWTYGVNPGGLAASGPTLLEAYIAFRNSLMEVLFDIATEANTSYAFRARAKKFFEETNEPTRLDWEDARQQVRSGKVTIDGMRRETSEEPRRIDIKIKQKLSAKDNATDARVSVAA